MPDIVIFDIDGTLLDSVDYHARAWAETFRRHGIDVAVEDVRTQIGKGGDQLMPVFVSKERLEREGDELKEERSRYFKETYLDRVRPFPKVRELVARLSTDGKRVILASSATRDELEEYKRIAGIADLLEADTSSDDAERSKPHPDIFLAAMAKVADADPERVIVVGDTPYDAQAASQARLAVIGVLCGGFPESELRRAGCRAIFRDPADLLIRYDEWAAG
jgi:HAD superfamily hydrolase (TIGR01549 family)